MGEDLKQVLVIDFSVVVVTPDKHILCWSGLLLNATTPVQVGSQLAKCVVALGGRFDNLCAHYQLEVVRTVPQSVGCVFKISEIAKQLIERQKDTASRIDVCIGSCGSALVEEKVKLTTDLQSYRHPMSVHCDYSEDMN